MNFFSTLCNPFGFLRHNNEKKYFLYFCTSKIVHYESPPTYAFGYILRRSAATDGGMARTGTTAVYDDSGHGVPHGRRGDASGLQRILPSIQKDVSVL